MRSERELTDALAALEAYLQGSGSGRVQAMLP